MKKGDATKQEILSIADRLFCTKGYDETSVQDILNIMHGTKGGFYHHFPSKAAVLETLCRSRAESACEKAQHDMALRSDCIARLNILFREMNPLRMEEMAFIAMLLPLLSRPEGMSIRVVYQEALLSAFSLPLTQEIARGTESGVLFPVAADMAEPVLNLVNSCWMEACRQMLSAIEANQRCEAAPLQAILTRYRRAVETLLDAPYGSLVLMELETWSSMASHLTAPRKGA